MRHLGKVGADDIARDILAEGYVQLALGVTELRRVDYLTHGYHGFCTVGHFDTDSGFAGYRRLYTHARCGKAHGDIVRKRCDLVYADSRVGHKLISCDGRAAADIGDLRLDLEALEGSDELLRAHLHLSHAVGVAVAFRLLEAVHGREHIIALDGCALLGRHEFAVLLILGRLRFGFFLRRFGFVDRVAVGHCGHFIPLFFLRDRLLESILNDAAARCVGQSNYGYLGDLRLLGRGKGGFIGDEIILKAVGRRGRELRRCKHTLSLLLLPLLTELLTLCGGLLELLIRHLANLLNGLSYSREEAKQGSTGKQHRDDNGKDHESDARARLAECLAHKPAQDRANNAARDGMPFVAHLLTYRGL